MTTQRVQPNPPLLHNRYRILTRLGANRLADVFRATDERLSRSVLVHVLRPDLENDPVLRQRFQDESQKMAQRAHPALLDVYDRGEVGVRPYMVTEDVAGHTLAEALPLPTHKGLQILRQVVGAVVTTQTSGMVVPPIISNAILVTAEGRPVLVEPWWISQAQLRQDMAYYRAPEIIEGGPPSDRSVVYALGMLAYEIFLGKRPWAEYDAEAVQQRHLTHDLPPLHSQMNDFMPSLSAALSLATTRDVQRRTFDAQAFSRELAAVDASAEAITRPLVRPMPAFRDSVREARKTITQKLRSEATPPPGQAPSAWAVPPPQAYAPRPVMPPPRQVVQPSPANQPALSPDDVRREVRREVRRHARRQGLLRFIRRRLVGLIFLALLVGGCFWSFTLGRDWITSGEAKVWACGYIPDYVCEFIPGPATIVQPVRYVVISPELNIRAQPSTLQGDVIETLPENTIVIAPDPNDTRVSEGIEWIRVFVDYNNRRIDGWVALSFLQEE